MPSANLNQGIQSPYQAKTPSSPGPDISVRTLASDVKTLQESGGVAPQPQRINVADLENGSAIQPQTTNQLPGGAVTGPSKAGKLVAAIAGSVVIVVGLFFLGFYVIYPLLSPQKAPTTVVPTTTVSIPKPAALPHVSLFATAPSLQDTVVVSDVTVTDIIGKLQEKARDSATVAPGSVKELSIADLNGQVSASSYLNALVPELPVADLKNVLEDDFTAFLYYDDKGVWPGYVFKLKPVAVPAQALQVFAQLEAADIAKFYLDDPKTHGEFKAGQVAGAADPFRYTVFQKPGASFDYGRIMNYILVTTAYPGLKAALGFMAL